MNKDKIKGMNLKEYLIKYACTYGIGKKRMGRQYNLQERFLSKRNTEYNCSFETLMKLEADFGDVPEFLWEIKNRLKLMYGKNSDGEYILENISDEEAWRLWEEEKERKSD